MKNFFSILKEYSILTFGTVIYVLAWTSFLIPNGIASGGGTGLCTIVYFASNETIPVSVSFFVLNAILLIIGFMVLGKGFGFKTIYIIILSTLLFDIFPRLDWTVVFDEKFLVAVVGGALEAVGIGIVLMKGLSRKSLSLFGHIYHRIHPPCPGQDHRGHDIWVCGHDNILFHGGFCPPRTEVVGAGADFLVKISGNSRQDSDNEQRCHGNQIHGMVFQGRQQCAAGDCAPL